MWPYSMLKPLYCQNKTWSMDVQTYTKDLPVFLRQKKSDAIQWTVIFTPHAEWYPWEPWGVSSLLQEGETQKVVSTPSVAHDLNLRIVNMNAHNRKHISFCYVHSYLLFSSPKVGGLYAGPTPQGGKPHLGAQRHPDQMKGGKMTSLLIKDGGRGWWSGWIGR